MQYTYMLEDASQLCVNLSQILENDTAIAQVRARFLIGFVGGSVCQTQTPIPTNYQLEDASEIVSKVKSIIGDDELIATKRSKFISGWLLGFLSI